MTNVFQLYNILSNYYLAISNFGDINLKTKQSVFKMLLLFSLQQLKDYISLSVSSKSGEHKKVY